MRAVIYDRVGPDADLKLLTDRPLPARGQGKVLVHNLATSVNPVDKKLRMGYGGKLAGPKLPAIPGGDVAGVVAEADAGSQFKPGDRVMALTAFCVGSYSEYVVVPEAALARIPEGLSIEQAAALPLAGLTAVQALDLARLQRGQRVLIHAGAGGVGSFAIQIAKARGLHVTTTCSSRNADFVRQLGADEVIDYTQQRFEEVCQDKPFDGVLDTIAGDYEGRSFRVLKRVGTYVNFLARFELLRVVTGFLRGALGLGPRYRVVVVSPNGAQLEALAGLVTEGKVKPIIHSVLPLEKATEAQEQVATGHTRGKVVLRIAGDESTAPDGSNTAKVAD